MTDLPAIEADEGQMQQVVMNLIQNGAEAIGARRGTITVTTDVEIVESRDNAYSTQYGLAFATWKVCVYDGL